MTPVISIGVPVFNVASYVGACLESILGQTHSEIEIICVDDASTDGSVDALQAAVLRDSRVVLLRHTHNRGLSAARNTALQAARAPWLLFVDSDDVVSRHLCERTLAAANRFSGDAVFYNFRVFRDGGAFPAEPVPFPPALADRSALLRRPAFAWTKLVRTGLMRQRGILFPEGLCFEDIPVHWRLAIESERPVFLDEPLVFYRQRSGSITYRTDWARADALQTWDMVENYLRSTGRWTDWKHIFIAGQLRSLAGMHSNYSLRNPALTGRVREEARARLSREHWEFVLHGNGLRRWERDYLIACSRTKQSSRDLSLLLPVLRHRLRDPLRRLWHTLVRSLHRQ